MNVANGMTATVDRELAGSIKVDILPDLYHLFSKNQLSLVDVTWIQHQYHEKRRWSAVELIDNIQLADLTEQEQLYIWNAGRAELTTKPGADRLARLADFECRRWQGVDDYLSAVLQSCGTWSRYWNEEESFHEASFGALTRRLGLETVSDATFIEFRKIFPDDNMLRTLFLLAISEITAATNYTSCAALAKDPALKHLFKRVAADEIQHMRYFISFSKALVDSGQYFAKDAFAIAHLFLRENGELEGSTRTKVEHRDSHVNWWDALEISSTERPDNPESRHRLIFNALETVTGMRVHSAQEVEECWMEMLG